MSERGILFSGPMVRAILAGAKTQTRRIVRGDALESLVEQQPPAMVARELSPWQVGSRLWVRETWCAGAFAGYDAPPRDGRPHPDTHSAAHHPVFYRATEGDVQCRWRPSIYMPRWASRIALEITDVRVERLQAITEADARAEVASPCDRCRGTGIDPVRVDWDPDWCSECGGASQSTRCVDAFAELWDTINGKRAGASWAENPWVWALTFRRVE